VMTSVISVCCFTTSAALVAASLSICHWQNHNLILLLFVSWLQRDVLAEGHCMHRQNCSLGNRKGMVTFLFFFTTFWHITYRSI
jgi:hypothetical protein